MFSDQFGSIFIKMKVESKDRGAAQSKPFVHIKTNHIKLRLKHLWVSKVNLTLNQKVLEMLDVPSVRGLEIIL